MSNHRNQVRTMAELIDHFSLSQPCRLYHMKACCQTIFHIELFRSYQHGSGNADTLRLAAILTSRLGQRSYDDKSWALAALVKL